MRSGYFSQNSTTSFQVRKSGSLFRISWLIDKGVKVLVKNEVLLNPSRDKKSEMLFLPEMFSILTLGYDNCNFNDHLISFFELFWTSALNRKKDVLLSVTNIVKGEFLISCWKASKAYSKAHVSLM